MTDAHARFTNEVGAVWKGADVVESDSFFLFGWWWFGGGCGGGGGLECLDWWTYYLVIRILCSV